MLRNKSKSVKTSQPLDLDPEILDTNHNQVRRPILPYATVLNDKVDYGIFIEPSQLKEAGWIPPVDSLKLRKVSIGDKEAQGLLLQKVDMVVLGATERYIRHKAKEVLATAGVNPALALSYIAPYETNRELLDKKTMEVCSEYVLVFMKNKQPLHTTPFVVRFRSVALWSLLSALDKYYTKVEKVFAKLTNQKFSPKSDRWRALVIAPITFKAEREGEGSNKSYCCKTVITAEVTPETLATLIMTSTTEKDLIWELHDEVSGLFVSPANTDTQPEISASGKQSNLQVSNFNGDDDFDNDDDDFDNDDDNPGDGFDDDDDDFGNDDDNDDDDPGDGFDDEADQP
jgi:hypothetical protein